MSRTPVPAAASKIIRARSASFLGVVCARTSRVSTCSSAAVVTMGSADRRGMATSANRETNHRFAMTHRGPLDSPARQLRDNQPDIFPGCGNPNSPPRPWSRYLRRAALGSALASGDLVSHGVVVGATWVGDVEDLGAIRQLRPEAWRMPGAREAVSGEHATGRLVQDERVLTPIIERCAFFAWRRSEFENRSAAVAEQQSAVKRMPNLSYGVHAIPSGT